MDYYRINSYVEENKIDTIFLFLGNYLHIIDISIQRLKRSLSEGDYHHLEDILTKKEITDISNDKVKLFVMNENILEDDSILEIKQKIKLASIDYDEDIIVEGMYLHAITKEYVNAESLFFSLSNGELSISGEVLLQKLENFDIKEIDQDEMYTFDDFVQLGFDAKHIQKFTPVGIKFANENIPTSLFYFNGANDVRSSVENNRFLSEYKVHGKLLKLIYLNTDKELNQTEINTYYPSLVQFGVESNSTFLLKHEQIKKSVVNQVDKNVINKFRNIKELYEKSNENGVQNMRIQSLSFIIKSHLQETLPLETIFKAFASSEEIPLIKFNPGKKKEYIYRLYSNERNKENVKLPFVSKAIIRRYMSETRGKNNKYITFFMFIDHMTIFNINIFESGDVEVVTEYKNKTNTYEQIENLIRVKVDMIYRAIESNLNVPSHYIFDKFDRVNDINVILKNVNFYFDYNFSGNSKKLNQKINDYASDMNYVFKVVHNSNVNIAFDYTRVSIYDEIVPKIIVDINNKLLSVKVSDVRNLSYLDSIPLFMTGLINMIDTNSSLEKSKIQYIKDVDEETNKKQNYLTKFDDKQDDMEDDIEENDEVDDESESESESDEEDIVDDDVDEQDEGDDESLGVSIHSDKSFFVENDHKMDKDRGQDMENRDGADDDDDDDSIGFSVASNQSRFGNEQQSESNETLGLGSDDDNSLFGGGKSKTYDYTQQRIKSYDPILFEKNNELQNDVQLKYKTYSKTCPTSEQRQPIILTKEEKDKIDKKHPGSYGNHYLKYSSNPENPYYYICPRYWCVDKSISLNEEDVYKDASGNTVSDYCKDDDGDFGAIITSDLQRQHRDKDDPSKYVYNRPGFGKSCIPCCFKQNKQLQDDKNVKKSKAQEEKNKKLLTVEPRCLIDDKAGKDITHESDENSDDDRIDEVDNKKESPVLNVKGPQLNYIKQADKFPLEQNQIGDVSKTVKRFLHVHNQATKNNFVRFGVENHKQQSFVACLSYLYTFDNNKREKDLTKIVNKVQKIKSIKKEILKLVDLNVYSGLHSGDVNTMFYNENLQVTKKIVNKYKESKVIKSIDSDNEAEKLINSYENFINYIKDDKSVIDHKILWEVSQMLFNKHYNLIVVEYDISNDDIHLICPVNNYTHQLEKFHDKKPSFIILKQKEFYEPIIFYSKEKSLNLQYIHAPNGVLSKFLQNVSSLYRNTSFCGVQPSSEYSKHFYENTSEFVEKLLKHSGYEIMHQVVNNKFQNVGFIVKVNNKYVYLPIYPSGQLNNTTVVYIYGEEFQKFIHSYEDTKKAMNEIHENTNNEIPSHITKKGVFDGDVVGVYTASNDYIPCVREKNQTNDKLQEHVIFTKNEKGDYLDPIYVNRQIAEHKFSFIDEESDMEKLLLNQQLYNNFRSHVMTTLSSSNHRSALKQIHYLVNAYNISYKDKFSKIKKILSDTASKTVSFQGKKKSKDEYLKDSKIKEASIVLPKNHLLNNLSNVTEFYNRLVDELIRYKKYNKFFEIPKQYVMNSVQDYQLQEDELITFQSFLQSYFLNQSVEGSKEFGDNFNLANPHKSIEYSNEIFDDELFKNIIETENKYLTVRAKLKD